jgi:serine/threonine protein kinase
MTSTGGNAIKTFGLKPGRLIGGRYVVDGPLGGGWEGEVYRIRERRTGAPRAAKLFFPQRNHDDRAVDFYARKLEQLRACPIVIKYHHSETVRVRGLRVTALISEFVEGVPLEDLIRSRPGRRLPEQEALQILHALALGLEQIHDHNEYHGDLHPGNVLVQRRGVHFGAKLVDLYDFGRPSAANRREDVINAVRLLYDMLGGQKWYARQRPELRWIIAGLKRSIIARRFPTARRLREHLDAFEWGSP